MRGLVFALCWFVVAFANAGDGNVDPAFGTGGSIVQTPADASLFVYSGLVQADSKIVVSGNVWFFNANQNKAPFWRFLPDGTPDPTFGINGFVSIPLGVSFPLISALYVQPDDAILASGSLNGFGMIRLLGDGSLDHNFGSSGGVLLDFSDLGVNGTNALGITVDSEGRILLAGAGAVIGYPNWPVGLIARLTPTGALDRSFGTAGRVVVQFGNSDSQLRAVFFDVATDAMGRIWLSGNGNPTQDPIPTKFLAARLDVNGTLDTTFGGSGIVAAYFDSTTQDRGAHSLLRGNQLTIAGTCDAIVSVIPSLCLLRLLEDGSADPSFGNLGWADVPVGSGLYPFSSIACQADGRCLILGTEAPASNKQFIVARVDQTGVLDATFGTGGISRINVPATYDGSHVAGRAIALQGGQPILIGTTDGVPSVPGLFVTRLTADEIFGSTFE